MKKQKTINKSKNNGSLVYKTRFKKNRNINSELFLTILWCVEMWRKNN